MCDNSVSEQALVNQCNECCVRVEPEAVGLKALNVMVEASRRFSVINPSLPGRQNQGVLKGEIIDCSQRCPKKRVHFTSLARLSVSPEA